MIKKNPLIPHRTVFWIIPFLLTWCMHIQNYDITAVTSLIYIWHHITNKLYSLNCWYYSVVYKKSCSQLMIFVSLSIEKNYNPLLLTCPLCPTLPPVHPLNLIHILLISLAVAVSKPALYRLLIFQVPNLIPLFHCLGRTKVSVQGRGLLCEYFVTLYIFTVRSC